MRGQGRETGVTAETGERQLSVTLEVRNQLQLHYVNSFRNQSSLAQEQGYFAQSSVEKASASLCQQAVIQGCPVPRVQFSSAAQSSLTLCDPMDCSTPGLPVHHQLQVWKIMQSLKSQKGIHSCDSQSAPAPSLQGEGVCFQKPLYVLTS